MRLDGPSTTRETGGVGLKFDLGTGDPVRRLSDHAPSQNRVSFLPSVKPEDSPILDHPPIQASECAGAHHPKTDHRESLSRPRDSGSISSSMPSSVIKGRSRLSSASSQTVKFPLDRPVSISSSFTKGPLRAPIQAQHAIPNEVMAPSEPSRSWPHAFSSTQVDALGSEPIKTSRFTPIGLAIDATHNFNRSHQTETLQDAVPPFTTESLGSQNEIVYKDHPPEDSKTDLMTYDHKVEEKFWPGLNTKFDHQPDRDRSIESAGQPSPRGSSIRSAHASPKPRSLASPPSKSAGQPSPPGSSIRSAHASHKPRSLASPPSNMHSDATSSPMHTKRITLSALVSKPIKNQNKSRASSGSIKSTRKTSRPSSFTPLINPVGFRAASLGCLGVLFMYWFYYFHRLRLIGYCDDQMNSNSMTRNRQIDDYFGFDDHPSEPIDPSYLRRISLLVRRQTQSLMRSIESFNACRPCPAHAICSKGKISRCEVGFKSKERMAWQDRIRWVMPITLFETKCVPTKLKLKRIIKISEGIMEKAKEERDRILCEMSVKEVYLIAKESKRIVTHPSQPSIYHPRLAIQPTDFQRYFQEVVSIEDELLCFEEVPRNAQAEELLKLSMNYLLKTKSIYHLRHRWFLVDDRRFDLQSWIDRNLSLACRAKLALFRVL